MPDEFDIVFEGEPLPWTKDDVDPKLWKAMNSLCHSDQHVEIIDPETLLIANGRTAQHKEEA